VGTSPEKVLPLVQSLWSNNGASPASQPELVAFGDGSASDRIIQILIETYQATHTKQDQQPHA